MGAGGVGPGEPRPGRDDLLHHLTKVLGGERMASSREQELAKDIVVAWLNYMASIKPSSSPLNEATSAATIVASMYQVIAKAIEETSPPPPSGSPSI
jgi:hypothetical protein